MIILGIDPGTAIIGFGVIKKNRELKLINYGCIKTPISLTTAERLPKGTGDGKINVGDTDEVD